MLGGREWGPNSVVSPHMFSHLLKLRNWSTEFWAIFVKKLPKVTLDLGGKEWWVGCVGDWLCKIGGAPLFDHSSWFQGDWRQLVQGNFASLSQVTLAIDEQITHTAFLRVQESMWQCLQICCGETSSICVWDRPWKTLKKGRRKTFRQLNNCQQPPSGEAHLGPFFFFFRSFSFRCAPLGVLYCNDIPPSPPNLMCWFLYRFMVTIALGRFNSIIVDGCFLLLSIHMGCQVGPMDLLSVLLIWSDTSSSLPIGWMPKTLSNRKPKMAAKAATCCTNEKPQSWLWTLSMFANTAMPFRPQFGWPFKCKLLCCATLSKLPSVKIRFLRIHILRTEDGPRHWGWGITVTCSCPSCAIHFQWTIARYNAMLNKNERKTLTWNMSRMTAFPRKRWVDRWTTSADH